MCCTNSLVLVTLCEENHFSFIEEWYEQMRRLQWYKRGAAYEPLTSGSEKIVMDNPKS